MRAADSVRTIYGATREIRPTSRSGKVCAGGGLDNLSSGRTPPTEPQQ